MCTIPVPSSIETKSPATTSCAPSTFGYGGSVSDPDEVGPAKGRDHLSFLAQDTFAERGTDDEQFVVDVHHRVRGAAVNGETFVGRKRPRRGRPHEERNASRMAERFVAHSRRP